MSELRVFTARDSAAAATLHALCFAHDPWPADAFVALMASESQGFALWDEQKMIGLILARPAADEAEILTFAVAPAHRRQGYGEMLLVQSMAALAAQPVARLFLEVAEDNKPARYLYSKLGFEIVAERTGYYHHGSKPKTALVMACNLADLAEK